MDNIFGRPGPLEIDLGCGKGRFLLSRAGEKPDTNFIGIDRLLVRLRKVDRKITAAGIENVRLLRIEASYAVKFLIPRETVNVYHILFPDPWPKRRHHRRRLFNREFMDSIHVSLRPGGMVHTATDYLPYLEHIRLLLEKDPRFRISAVPAGMDSNPTDFEIMFAAQNKQANRLCFEKT